jgi:hypothetical protein
MSAKPLVVRPKTAARMLDIGKTTLFSMIKDGRLERVQLGQRATGVTVESIEKLIKNGMKQPAA